MSMVEKRLVSDDEADMRLDRWFKHHFPQISHIMLSKLLRKGQIRLDGGRVKANRRLMAGQEIRIPPMAENSRGDLRVKPSAQPLSTQEMAEFQDMILHEDDHLIVLNKPSGLAVQGGSGTKRHIDGMLQALEHVYKERPRLVHRLDRDTSGLLVVAKKRGVASKLGTLFASRSVHKIYWALSAGCPKPPQGKIDRALIKSGPVGAEKMRQAHKGEVGALKAVTHYSVIDNVAGKLAWISMQPVTGRQHQLRAHLALIGTPIIGDGKYGAPREGFEQLANRLHLHARRISFPHPAGGKLDVTAPLPKELQDSWRFFGFDPERYDGGKFSTDEQRKR